MSDALAAISSPADVAGQAMPYICCAADRTYRAGTMPDGLKDDAPGAATADPRSLGIEVTAELYGPARYHWRFPADGFVKPTSFTQDLHRFYADIATHNCPASVLVRMEDVVLANSVLYAAASASPAIVYETFRPNDRPALCPLTRIEVMRADPERSVDRNWRNVFVGSAGSANYGHWLIDDLPRLKAVTALGSMSSRPVRILIHGYGMAIDAIRIESIRLLFGPDIDIALLDPNTSYRFQELYYATPVSGHPIYKSPIAIDHIVRETTFHAIRSGSGCSNPTLLFVNRNPDRGRKLSNYKDIERLVTSYGFTTINPENMAFVDQVRSFACAQVVIGQMGAAMTNTVFCRPSTTLIYLAPAGWIEPFYWDLSVVRGQNYRVLFGDVADAADAPHSSNFSIDCDALKSAIKAL